MAKVGNETKLVLRLAAEKARAKLAGFTNEETSTTAKQHVMGFQSGVAWYERTLLDIILELEGGRS